MSDTNLLGVLQTIMQENQKGMKLCDLCFGTVASASPLTITLEGTMQPLPTVALVLCDSVVDRSETVTATDSDGDRVTVTVPISRALKGGERVVMLRCSGGQRFIVLSRAH